MAARAERFPLFPLELVAVPGELVPLHVFEERYRVMFAELLDVEGEFGIVWATPERLRSTGCACAIERVLRRHEDGRLDVLTRGTRRMRLDGELEHVPYPAAPVTFPEDRPEDAGGTIAESARAAYAQLVTEITDEPPAADQLAGMDAFGMAATVELGLEAKQALLELPSESGRLRLLTRLFRDAVSQLDEAQRREARARSNGKVHLP